MKKWYILSLLAALLGISACFDSGTGFDDPCADFDPALTTEALAWITPFGNNTNPWVFENSEGQRDTVKTLHLQGSAYCYNSGDCFLPTKLERGIVQWPRRPELYWAIKAYCNDQVEINGYYDPNSGDAINPASELTKRLNCRFRADLPDLATPMFSAGKIQLLTDYSFQGQNVTALQMYCDSEFSPCDSFAIRQFVVSPQLGLLEYQTTDGTAWKRR